MSCCDPSISAIVGGSAALRQRIDLQRVELGHRGIGLSVDEKATEADHHAVGLRRGEDVSRGGVPR